MKIGYLGIGERYGASHAGFVHTYSIAESLNKIEGNQVKLYIRSPEQETGIEEPFEVNLYDLKFNDFKKPFRTLKQVKKLRSELKQFDIIQERFRFNPINNLITHGYENKLILEVNGPAHEKLDFPKTLFLPTIQRKLDSAAKIIVQTETLKQIIGKHTETPIHVIPNGVDTEKFTPEHDQEDEIIQKYGISTDKPTVVFVGSFGRWHGTEKIPEIAREIPEAQFLLVGNGEMYREVEKKSQDLENVVLTGKVPHDEVPPILAASEIGIAPFNLDKRSDMDKNGFYFCPVKIFEYMAAGLPTVSFDLTEVANITEGSGVLAEDRNWEQVKEKTGEIIQNKEKREKKSEIARERAKNNFDWSEIAYQTQQVYRQLLE